MVGSKISLLLVLFSGITPAVVSIEEPAVLLSTATYRDINDVNDTLFTLACVAYGEPLPHIEWLVRSDQDDAFAPVNTDTGFIITSTAIVTSLDGFDIISVLSVLVACEGDLSGDVNGIECSANNGLHVDGFVGYQRAVFSVSSNFSTRFLLGELPPIFRLRSLTSTSEPTPGRSTQPADGMQTTAVAMQPTASSVVLIISVSVVACVALLSIALISGTCIVTVGLYKRTASEMYSPSPLFLPVPSRDLPLRSKPGNVSAKPDHTYASVNITTPPGYSNLHEDWSAASNTGDSTVTTGDTQQYQPGYENVVTSNSEPEPQDSPRSMVYCSAYGDSGSTADTKWIYCDSPGIGHVDETGVRPLAGPADTKQ